MASLLLRDIPEHIHVQLRLRARTNRRSLNSELLSILSASLASEWQGRPTLEDLDRVRIKPLAPFTDEFLAKAKSEGRP